MWTAAVNLSMIETIVNNQTSGGNLYPQAKGNESNLTETVRVIMGNRWVYDFKPLAIIKQYNNAHPDQGFVRALYGDLEGVIENFQFITVNGAYISPVQSTLRRGDVRQAPTNFSPNAHNYSGTAYFQAVYGPVNPAPYNTGNLRGAAAVAGLRIKKLVK
jgi:hypothetical protein